MIEKGAQSQLSDNNFDWTDNLLMDLSENDSSYIF